MSTRFRLISCSDWRCEWRHLTGITSPWLAATFGGVSQPGKAFSAEGTRKCCPVLITQFDGRNCSQASSNFLFAVTAKPWPQHPPLFLQRLPIGPAIHRPSENDSDGSFSRWSCDISNLGLEPSCCLACDGRCSGAFLLSFSFLFLFY